MSYRSPVPLLAQHQLAEFNCSSQEQTTWPRRHARQSAASGSTRVFVVTEVRSDQVVAYYAWSMAQLSLEAAPERVRPGAGRYPQPVALLARLGVDTRHEGRGLGVGLLTDVLLRFVAVADEIGTRATPASSTGALTRTNREAPSPATRDTTSPATGPGPTTQDENSDERHVVHNLTLRLPPRTARLHTRA